jgi:formamidopyrimidine-DNA glycosylase
MPELAEVEYYRRLWNPGIGERIDEVVLNGAKRIFRGSEPKKIEQALRGAKLLGSEAHGKQMLFRFSKEAWLGVHLGMTGELRVEPPDFKAGKHDHLVLRQKRRALVFSDARMFGRLRFHDGKSAPEWWTKLPPAVLSREFSLKRFREVLQRRRRAPLKAVLLLQEFFPGVGNWMADEILWQARLNPHTHAGALDDSQQQTLWRMTKHVCRVALKTIGPNWGDPPKNWLIHRRWKAGGICPRDGTKLSRATIGGRTTAWCPKCQAA